MHRTYYELYMYDTINAYIYVHMYIHIYTSTLHLLATSYIATLWKNDSRDIRCVPICRPVGIDLTIATFDIAALDCYGTVHHHFLFSHESYP